MGVIRRTLTSKNASGELFAGSCYSFFATSGVFMSGFFEELALIYLPKPGIQGGELFAWRTYFVPQHDLLTL